MKKEIEIPEGYEARIEDNKVIIEQKESEDERIRKSLVEYFRRFNPKDMWDEVFSIGDVLSYLEKQKEQIVIKQNIIDSIRANTQPDWDFSTIPNLREEINRFFGKKFVLPHTEDTIITVSDVIRCAYHFYKFGQQEQKPAEKLSKEEYVKKFKALFGAYEIKLPNREYDIYGLCEDLHKLFGDIQKPAEWSEDTIRKAIEEVGLTQHQINWFKNNVFPPKQEWSEEDKVMLNNIIWSVHMKSIIKPLYEMDDRSRYKKYEDFLKALPERFNLQPRTEWSEEEMKVLDSIIDDYEKANKSFCGYAGKIAFLKAIRDGEYDLPKQEWSEEDKKRLESVIHRTEVICGGNMYGVIKEDINWLKSLRPQPHWKPSEEKMVALDAAISHLEESDNEDYEILNSLYEDLKKL